MKPFTLDCQYPHPCRSLVLDLNGLDWNDIFTAAELDKMLQVGTSVNRPLRRYYHITAGTFPKTLIKLSDSTAESSSSISNPCHSLILDLDDANWNDVFTDKEIKELKSLGKPIVRPVPDELQFHLD
ncbi:unnamed protein product [Absidia cylindrospora]